MRLKQTGSCILFVFFTHFCHFVKCVSFATISQHLKFSHKLTVGRITMMHGLSLMDCIRECDARAACLSINFYRRVHMCELNDMSSSGSWTLVKTPGAVFAELPHWVTATGKTCGDQLCNSKQACDEDTGTCVVRECSPTTYLHEGNMNAVGDTISQSCPDGLMLASGDFSTMSTCQNTSAWNPPAVCIQVTCISVTQTLKNASSGAYKSLDFGSNKVVDIFCDFRTNYGYTYISRDTLKHCSSLANHTTRSDHVMVRHLTQNDIEKEVEVAVLSSYSSKYNVSVFLSRNTDFITSGKIVDGKPYLYMGFVPISYGSVNHTNQGYRCAGQDIVFNNCDGNANNYFILFDPDNNVNPSLGSWLSQNPVMNAWLVKADSVVFNMPETFYFKQYEMHMGGCGGLMFQNSQDAVGVAFGLLFDR